MLLRMVLFTATNFAIMGVITIVWRVLGIDEFLTQQGFSLQLVSILPFALAFGMGGAFVSLAISKWMALRSTGAQVIENPNGRTEQWLVDTVRRQAEQAGIGMPDVAIFDSAQPNAFATGTRRNSALVAVSTGLVRNMTPDEVEAVLAHEVSHVANGDMITLTLIQGVLNTFVLIFSRLIGMAIDRVILKNERGNGPGYWLGTIVAQVVLGILATMIVMWFSRRREFKADEGGAALSSRHKMASALRRLQSQDGAALPESLEAFGINGRRDVGFKRLFMSHPPLDERIAALENGR